MAKIHQYRRPKFGTGPAPGHFCRSRAGAVAGAPTGNKVGIVSIQDAIASTNEGKKELDALQQSSLPDKQHCRPRMMNTGKPEEATSGPERQAER